MHRHLCKALGITKNRGNRTPPKEKNKLLATDLRVVSKWRYMNGLTKKFKIVVLKKLRSIREHRKTIY